MYSNEKQNILWLTKMENNVLLVRDIPLSDFDTGADDGKTIKLENVDSSLVLLPDNKLAFVDTERRIFSISMMTGEQTPIPAQFEASARCSLLGLVFFFIILKYKNGFQFTVKRTLVMLQTIWFSTVKNTFVSLLISMGNIES